MNRMEADGCATELSLRVSTIMLLYLSTLIPMVGHTLFWSPDNRLFFFCYPRCFYFTFALLPVESMISESTSVHRRFPHKLF
ncbi:hypothetical protein CPB83DRAFT_662791 [Crepidotus variabilis]|uniref:Uncharacterized protein n=1 Tax=Crepidotus variabilis TaxID=179855 RepID=A0A9P6EN44_9AGAR|nr:hypothetical protein CPB83DRAFT_662791 [Crepidotus variabilis]